MKKKLMEQLVNNLLKTNADYSEVYYEDTIEKRYNYINKKLDDIYCNTLKGVSFRILKSDQYYFSSTNDFEEENLFKVTDILKNKLKGFSDKQIKLTKIREYKADVKISHDKRTTEEKVNYLAKIDKIAREFSPLISQVSISLLENDKHKTIANSNGVLAKNEEVRTRLFLTVYANNKNTKTSTYKRIDLASGYEMLDDINLTEFVKETCQDAIEELTAKQFNGGEYPVIIENGFGALIFHEACGHALEAQKIATNLSVLADKYNSKIASEKVTLIDDGSIKKSWGSSIIDDEGEYAKKNILIKDGILTNYLVDRLNSIKINHKLNGASRRESYLYAPTSRMSNTYLQKGNDNIEDMLKSIDKGIYIKDISHGSVRPSTGEFNFYTKGAYKIEHGKITDRIKNVSLIGNCLDILNKVEMVADNLKIEGGYCGADSGLIYITAGQPTIKVSKMLVGGNDE